jgi:hypothetical protein
MKVNILEPPMSRDEISTMKGGLERNIVKLKANRTRTGQFFFWSLLCIIVAGVTGNAIFYWLPWAMLTFAYAYSTIFGIVLGVFADIFFVVIAAIIGVPTLVLAVTGGYSLAAICSAICIIVLAVTFQSFRAFQMTNTAVDNQDKDLELLGDANADDCLEIRTWLSLPEVLKFRDAVVNESCRKFIVAEVEAMRDFYNSFAEQENELAKKKACKEVYLEKVSPQVTSN